MRACWQEPGQLVIVAGDFNGDGRLDLATGNVGSSDISVLFGKGDGTFEAPPESSVGNGATAVATGDFTGNGNLGVAVLNQGSDSVTILPGNGDGTFQQALTVALPQGSGATSIVAADFNNDGRTDLAVTDTNLDEVTILLGNGDGTFQSSTIPVPGGPFAIVAGDFTGNGQTDLAVVDQNSNSVTILIGSGDGKFSVGQTITLVNPADPTNPYYSPGCHRGGQLHRTTDTSTWPSPSHSSMPSRCSWATATARLPKGPRSRSASPSPSTPITCRWWPEISETTALPTWRWPAPARLEIPSTCSWARATGPSRTPAAPSRSPSVSASIPSRFSREILPTTASSTWPPLMAAGVDPTTTPFTWAKATARSCLSYPRCLVDPGALPTALAVGDFAGNGRTDLAIARTSPDSVQVVLSNNDGTFSSPSVVDLVRPETPLVADLNGDGAMDVSVVDAAGDILYRAGQAGRARERLLPR